MSVPKKSLGFRKNPSGGMHHICYEVDDILLARDRMVEAGARVLGDGQPKTGA
ncbi:VOC family protein, partial [Rhizobium ruizarguesonis]